MGLNWFSCNVSGGCIGEHNRRIPGGREMIALVDAANSEVKGIPLLDVQEEKFGRCYVDAKIHSWYKNTRN